MFLNRELPGHNQPEQIFVKLLPEAIAARNISVTITSGNQVLPILKPTNWTLPKGRIQLLMGPSGSGKTTLLSVLAGLLQPTSGEVFLLGQEITGLTRAQCSQFRKQHVGFIFQDFNLFPALTALENVLVAFDLKGIKGKPAQTQAIALLEQVGLQDKMLIRPRQLSGGQQQRIAIARALAGDPEILFADEPTAALDSHSGHRVMELLRQLAREKSVTVLIVTHDPRILDLADGITHIEDGQLQNM